ncbi:MAG: hypothetical protein J6V77_04885 [Clostridia bacterium]|nr:hypothetical protein [Clostridia bacterium]MBO7152155.1 hypothetical protein [Clostridia bacterium]
MKKERRVLLKKFSAVVKDLLDNYDQYTDEEKEQVKSVFQKAVELNTVLDKYDVVEKLYWKEFIDAYGKYFESIKY